MLTKKCNSCGIEKELKDFHIDNSKKTKRREKCKLCRRYEYWMSKCTTVVELQAPTTRVNIWEWIKRLFG